MFLIVCGVFGVCLFACVEVASGATFRFGEKLYL